MSLSASSNSSHTQDDNKNNEHNNGAPVVEEDEYFEVAGVALKSGSRMMTSGSPDGDDDGDDEQLIEAYGEDEGGEEEFEEEGATVEPSELSEEIAATALSNLGHNPDGELVYTTMSLASLGLCGVTLLGLQYTQIQTLILDRNNLTTLAPLAAFTSLTTLSVAHNQLDAAGVFEALGGGGDVRGSTRPYRYLPASSTAYSPLRTLRKLVLHHNQIESLEGLKKFINCTHVDLGYNSLQGGIQEDVLSNMPALRYLDLSHNAIDEVDAWAFENTGLWDLDISHNNLSACAFVAMLQPTLVKLNIAGNSLMHFESIAGLSRLTTIDLSNNNAYELAEVLHLQDCSSLRFLHLTGNPAFVDAMPGSTSGGGKSAGGIIQQLVSTGGHNVKRGIGSGVEGEEDDDEDDGVAVDPAEALQALKRAAGGDDGKRRSSRGAASNKKSQLDGTSSGGAGAATGVAVLSPLETLRRKQRQECKSTGTSLNGTLLKSHRNTNSAAASLATSTTAAGGAAGGDAQASTESHLNVNASPDEEDLTELNSLSPAQQSRLRVLWRLPSLLELDGVKVSPEELALAQCLEGGVDRHQRQEAKERAFGANSGRGNSLSGSHVDKNNSSAVGGGRSAIAQLRQQR